MTSVIEMDMNYEDYCPSYNIQQGEKNSKWEKKRRA